MPGSVKEALDAALATTDLPPIMVMTPAMYQQMGGPLIATNSGLIQLTLVGDEYIATELTIGG